MFKTSLRLCVSAVVFLLAGAAHGQGQIQMANIVDCSTLGTNNSALNKQPNYFSGTNNWVAFSNQASQVFSVEIDNFSGGTIYLNIFEMGTNAVNGDVPRVSSVAIPTGSTGGKSWVNGAPFQSLCAAASTTPFRQTNAAAGLGTITVTRWRKPPGQ